MVCGPKGQSPAQKSPGQKRPQAGAKLLSRTEKLPICPSTKSPGSEMLRRSKKTQELVARMHKRIEATINSFWTPVAVLALPTEEEAKKTSWSAQQQAQIVFNHERPACTTGKQVALLNVMRRCANVLGVFPRAKIAGAKEHAQCAAAFFLEGISCNFALFTKKISSWPFHRQCPGAQAAQPVR